MSVFKSLAEEHGLLLVLAGRLERACDAKDARCLLLVLLRALEAHENLEHLVVDEESPTSGASAHIERQHAALRVLRAEALELLRDLGRKHDAAVRALIHRLTRTLRRHFQDEERTLWPSIHASAGRSRLQRLDRLARAQVQAMKIELDSYRIAVEDYLT